MASILKVDEMQGVTSAGDITITGEGTATMRLQQGLAKAWVRFDATSSNSVNDSFNVQSIRDNGTGQHGITLTSAMANTDWSVQCTGTASGTSGGTTQLDSSSWGGNGTSPYRTTTQANMRGVDNSDSSQVDHDDHNVAVFGDLA
jgi:hypothetical protein